MPITTYEDESQDFTSMNTNSLEESDSLLGLDLPAFNNVPESSSVTEFPSQSDPKSHWQPDSTRWLIITTDELTQTRARNILNKVRLLCLRN